MTARTTAVALVLAAAAAGALPASAGEASRAPAEAEGLVPPGVRRVIERLPGGPEFLREVEDGAADQSCECDFAFPLADVDGDGTTDVLRGVDFLGTPPRTRLTVLDGRTGEPLFPAPVEVTGWAYPAAADLGAHGKGFVYFAWDYVDRVDTVTVGAVGAGGSRLWERRWAETDVWSQAGRADVRGFHAADLVRDAKGHTEVVVASSASVATAAGQPETSTVLLERISGASGATVEAGTYEVEVLDDVTIDGLDAADGTSEVLIQTLTHVRDEVLVELRRDLAEAQWSSWVKPRFGSFMYPEEADVAGDRAAEILLRLGGPKRVQAFDRATGRPVWSTTDYVDGMVPSGAGGRDDVLTGATSLGDGTVGYTLSRKSVAGTSRWKASFRVTEQVHYSTWGFGSPYVVGDATGDGAADLRVDVYLYEDEGDSLVVRASKQYLVDGRSGTKVRGASTYFPLSGSFTRSGTDAIEFRRTGEGLEVSARDGATHRRLWRTALPVAPGSPPCSWIERVLETETGPDLLFLVLPTGHGDKELVLDGASGEILWSL